MEHVTSQGLLPLTLRGKLEGRAWPPPISRQDLTLILHPSPLNAAFLENFKIEPGWVNRTAIKEVQTAYVIDITVHDAVNGHARFDRPQGSMYNTGEVRFWTNRRCLNEFGIYIWRCS